MKYKQNNTLFSISFIESRLLCSSAMSSAQDRWQRNYEYSEIRLCLQ